MMPTEIDKLTRCVADFAAAVAQENAALARNDGAAALAPLGRAKILLADQLVEARARLGSLNTLAVDERAEIARLFAHVVETAAANASLIERKLDLVRELLGTLERDMRRHDGGAITLYQSDGRPTPDRPFPLAVDRKY